jgi:hypothetical protein
VTTIATVLTRRDAVAWTAWNYGPAHAEQRVGDAGWAFWVNTDADDVVEGRAQPVYGGLTVLILKRTGQYWHVGSNPGCHGVHLAGNERAMRAAMPAAGLNARRPVGTIAGGESTRARRFSLWPFGRKPAPTPSSGPEPEPTEGFGPAYTQVAAPFVDHERVIGWLSVATGWRHLESRVVDLGWAFSVSTQPDEYHDGGDPHAMTYGNGPMIVVKRTGAVWRLSSRPAMVPAFAAATEDDFDRVMRAGYPHYDPDHPPEWLPH